MKAISLYQPWASLVAIGAKRIETRSWGTKYRGPLAIHAAKAIPDWAEELCETSETFNKALVDAGIKYDGNTPLSRLVPVGAVIATCNLINCVKILGPTGRFIMLEKGGFVDTEGREYVFGDYTPGRYAWILEDVKWLPEPIPAKGHQGLWSWGPPESVEVFL